MRRQVCCIPTASGLRFRLVFIRELQLLHPGCMRMFLLGRNPEAFIPMLAMLLDISSLLCFRIVSIYPIVALCRAPRAQCLAASAAQGSRRNSACSAHIFVNYVEVVRTRAQDFARAPQTGTTGVWVHGRSCAQSAWAHHA